MSKGRKCNKAYWEIEAGLSKEPCFFVYNGECWKDAGLPCPMPKMPKDKNTKSLEKNKEKHTKSIENEKNSDNRGSAAGSGNRTRTDD